MSQTIVNKYQDQWQKGQVATSHYVRDTTVISNDVDEIEFGELLVIGGDEGTARQPDEILAAVTGKAYEIVSNLVKVSSAGHGLENNQKIIVENASPSTDLNGEHFLTIVDPEADPEIAEADPDNFWFLDIAGDNTGTLDYSVEPFTQKDIAGIVVNPVSGGIAKRFADGVINYKFGAEITVLEEGDIAIELGSDVKENNDAFYVHTPGGASPLHTYRNDADTDKAVQIPGRFRQDGVKGDIVKMRFNTDAVLGS